jgi:hypothetical protein
MAINDKAGGGRKPGIWLKKVARISSWLLLVNVAVLVVSGWGITQTGVIYRFTGGLIDRGDANAIHRGTVLPLSFFFLLHVMINISLGISGKHPLLKQIVNWVMIALGAGIMGIVIYMEYFRLGG